MDLLASALLMMMAFEHKICESQKMLDRFRYPLIAYKYPYNKGDELSDLPPGALGGYCSDGNYLKFQPRIFPDSPKHLS